MKDKVKKLVEEVDLLDPQDEIAWLNNREKRICLLTKDLNKTIHYFDECSERELYWATDSLEEVMEHFKSQELIACIERNVKRCKDEETVKYLEEELEYMRNMLE